MSTTFLGACLFDIRDTLILEDQLKQFEGESYSGESDSNQKQRTKHVINREKEAVNKFGGDLLNFELSPSVRNLKKKKKNGDLDGGWKMKKILQDVLIGLH